MSRRLWPASARGHIGRQIILRELEGRLDMSRVHFTGQLSYERLAGGAIDLDGACLLDLSVRAVLVALDAMACECLVIGSDTAPVRDVIRPA